MHLSYTTGTNPYINKEIHVLLMQVLRLNTLVPCHYILRQVIFLSDLALEHEYK